MSELNLLSTFFIRILRLLTLRICAIFNSIFIGINPIYVIILFINCFLCFLAQDFVAQERALAKIQYKFSHVNDTNKRDQPLGDEVVTYLGKVSSFYKRYSDERVKESISAQGLLPDYTGHMTLDMSTTAIKKFYILNSKERNTIELESISSSFDAYYRAVPYESQDWKIGDETKEIGGYLCQKAMGHFKGRVYVAWFTTEIPFPFGPWKLHGLPGLILTVEDILQKVKCEFAGFDLLESKDLFFIEVPFYVLKASEKEIPKLKDIFINDQGEYFKALNASNKITIANS